MATAIQSIYSVYVWDCACETVCVRVNSVISYGAPIRNTEIGLCLIHPCFFPSSFSLLPLSTWRGSGLMTTVCVELHAPAFVCGKSRRSAHHGQSDVKCPV